MDFNLFHLSFVPIGIGGNTRKKTTNFFNEKNAVTRSPRTENFM